MGLYNFKARFAAPIQAGTKRHTIRAPRKGGREDQPGDMMYLYTGLRTREAAKILAEPPVCVRVESIVIRNRVSENVWPEVWLGPFCGHIRDNGLRQQLTIHYPEQSGLGFWMPRRARAWRRRMGSRAFPRCSTFGKNASRSTATYSTGGGRATN